MTRLHSILLALLIPAVAFCGPIMVMEVTATNPEDWIDDAPYAWVLVADQAAAQALWTSYTNAGGYFEGVAVKGQWHHHLQDGRPGGGPACEVGDLLRQSFGQSRKWLTVESEEPRHWTDPAEVLVVPCVDNAERDKFEKRAKDNEFRNKKVKVK